LDKYGYKIVGLNDSGLVPWKIKKLYDSVHGIHGKNTAIYKTIGIKY